MKSRVWRGRAQLEELSAACCEIEFERCGGITSDRLLRGPRDCRPGACRTGMRILPER